MIRITNELPRGNCDNAITAKIYSLFKAYGCKYDFCSFWLQENEEHKITAIICKYHSSLTVFCDNADLNELKEFLCTVGYYEILCNISLNSKSTCLKTFCAKCNFKNTNVFSFDYHKAKNAFNILNQYPNEINLGEFSDWYVDMSHRIRHNTAVLYLSKNTAAICLLYQNIALLNGIAVKPECLGKGKGYETIKLILSGLNADKMFVICSEITEQFYLKCGFTKQKDIFYLKEVNTNE